MNFFNDFLRFRINKRGIGVFELLKEEEVDFFEFLKEFKRALNDSNYDGLFPVRLNFSERSLSLISFFGFKMDKINLKFFKPLKNDLVLISLNLLLKNKNYDKVRSKVKALIKNNDKSVPYITFSEEDLFVLDFNKKLVAGCLLGFHKIGQSMAFNDLIINKSYRRKGVGRFLIGKALKVNGIVEASQLEGPFEAFIKLGFKIPLSICVEKPCELIFEKEKNNLGNKRFDIRSNDCLVSLISKRPNFSFINQKMFNKKKGFFEVEVIYPNTVKAGDFSLVVKQIKFFLKKEFGADSKFVFEKVSKKNFYHFITKK